MKKLLLLLTVLSSLAVFAQKDIEVTLVKPDSNTTVYNGVEFTMLVQLKNVGATNIPATDSLDIAIYIDNVFYGGVNMNSHFHGLTAGQSDVLDIPVTIPITTYTRSSFCLTAVLYKNGVILDNNQSNDMGCQNVLLSPFKVGINTLEASVASVEVFPNPATDVVNISLHDPAATAITVKVFDISGQLIKTLSVENNNIQLNTSNLPSGMYFYQIGSSNNKTMSTGKFTVAH